MCMTCGCSTTNGVVFTDPSTGRQFFQKSEVAGESLLVSRGPRRAHGHDHSHADDHTHDHGHHHGAPSTVAAQHGATVQLEQEILGKNQQLADANRAWFAEQGILTLNLMSSPGSGKTTLLERTLYDLRDELSISVIEGDQATANDAERIRATGCKVLQINTGTGCHLEADMVARGIRELDPPRGSLVMIENVGNLVCPAMFDLGEHAKVVILSVTEGEDKPLKYPHMFRAASLMLLNKVDLSPYLRFDIERCIAFAQEVNPEIQTLRVSAATGEGMEAWYAWLRVQRNRLHSADHPHGASQHGAGITESG